jgi:hypothetical protein
MTLQIKQYDLEIQRMTQTEHAETQPLLTIHGIGHITALTFVRMLCSMRQIIAAWSRWPTLQRLCLEEEISISLQTRATGMESRLLSVRPKISCRAFPRPGPGR